LPLALWEPGTGHWSWATRQRSIPSKCKGELRHAELLATALENVPAGEAEVLATWVANGMGYLAAYPAPWTKGRRLFVAVTLKTDKADPYDPCCLYCLRGIRDGRKEILSFDDSPASSAKPEEGAGLTNFPCLACGETKPRIYTEYNALCYDCLKALAAQTKEAPLA
jgi:hypothetical protein